MPTPSGWKSRPDCSLTFDVAPNNDQEAKQKLNLVLASGELPDVIVGFGVSLADQQVLADQGMIIPVDDLIAEYGDKFKVMEEVPQIADITTLQDGKMYSLPDINECYHCTLAQKAWIYQPWLDKSVWKCPPQPTSCSRYSKPSRSRIRMATALPMNCHCRRLRGKRLEQPNRTIHHALVHPQLLAVNRHLPPLS